MVPRGAVCFAAPLGSSGTRRRLLLWVWPETAPSKGGGHTLAGQRVCALPTTTRQRLPVWRLPRLHYFFPYVRAALSTAVSVPQ